MIKLYNIPVIQIPEEDFVAQIPKRKYYDEPGQPNDAIAIESFIEVINENKETIALFYLRYGIIKEDFKNVLEFARYYDEMNSADDIEFWLTEEDEWKNWEEMCGTNDRNKISSDVANFSGNSQWEIFSYGYACIFLICYGRLKYPYGLEEVTKSKYEKEMGWELEVHYRLSDLSYLDEVADLINLALDIRDIRGEPFQDGIEELFDAGVAAIEPLAERIFTRENIDLYIDEANTGQKTEILAYLLDYKNKHFGMGGIKHELPDTTG